MKWMKMMIKRPTSRSKMTMDARVTSPKSSTSTHRIATTIWTKSLPTITLSRTKIKSSLKMVQSALKTITFQDPEKFWELNYLTTVTWLFRPQETARTQVISKSRQFEDCCRQIDSIHPLKTPYQTTTLLKSHMEET